MVHLGNLKILQLYLLSFYFLRFGFHIPPYNSIEHLHLHGFLLPFSDYVKDKFSYGHLLKDLDFVKIRINEKLNNQD
jgi:hypothetical protein